MKYTVIANRTQSTAFEVIADSAEEAVVKARGFTDWFDPSDWSSVGDDGFEIYDGDELVEEA